MKSLLVTMAVPPSCFLYLAVLGLLVAVRYRRLARFMVCLGLLGLTVLAMPVVAVSMIVALEQNLPVTPPADQPPQAIVILGGDMARVVEKPFAMPGLLTLDRLREGAALHRRTGLPILVTGGLVQEDRPPIATIMADALRADFQVPVAWVEDASVDTFGNATLSAEILRRQNIHSIYLVTQGWHMKRALLAFQHTGLAVTADPTSLTPPSDMYVSDFLPHATVWALSYYALHEWIGYAWYHFR